MGLFPKKIFCYISPLAYPSLIKRTLQTQTNAIMPEFIRVFNGFLTRLISIFNAFIKRF
jgi:hypothetical protein